MKMKTVRIVPLTNREWQDSFFIMDENTGRILDTNPYPAQKAAEQAAINLGFQLLNVNRD
jgi:hypothetical protein